VIFYDAVSHVCFALGLTYHPDCYESDKFSPKRLVKWNNFLGIQPTFTQVPPSPHFVPGGEGLT
jgi:hypothetical protein